KRTFVAWLAIGCTRRCANLRASNCARLARRKWLKIEPPRITGRGASNPSDKVVTGLPSGSTGWTSRSTTFGRCLGDAWLGVTRSAESTSPPLLVGTGSLGRLQKVCTGWMSWRSADRDIQRRSSGRISCREAGDLYSLEMMLLNSGGTALISGDLEQSKRFYVEALTIARRIDDRVAQYALLDGLGCVAAGSGQARLAGQLIGAAETVRTQAGAGLIPILAPLIGQAEALAKVAIGASKFDAAVKAGKGLTRDEAIRLALGEPAQAAAAAAANGEGSAPLGKREADVARLVAEGLSNKQIGARLF